MRIMVMEQNKDALDLLHRRSRASKNFEAHLLKYGWFLILARTSDLSLALDATRPFPERKWSLPSGSRQGFLTSGSSAWLHDLPNLK